MAGLPCSPLRAPERRSPSRAFLKECHAHARSPAVRRRSRSPARCLRRALAGLPRRPPRTPPTARSPRSSAPIPDTGRGVVASDGAFPAGLRIHRADPRSSAGPGADAVLGRDERLARRRPRHRGDVVRGPERRHGLTLRYEAGADVDVRRRDALPPVADGPVVGGLLVDDDQRSWADWQWASPQYDSCVARWAEKCRGRGSSDPFSAGNAVHIGQASADQRRTGCRSTASTSCSSAPEAGAPPTRATSCASSVGGSRSRTRTRPGSRAPRPDRSGRRCAQGAGRRDPSRQRSRQRRVPRPGRRRRPSPGRGRAPHPTGGACQDINAGDGDPYEFASSKPCRAEVNTSIGLDTTMVADGRTRSGSRPRTPRAT
jgi:hypothetical protein